VLVALLAAALLGLMLASCTTAADPTSPPDLQTTLTETGFDLSWQPLVGGSDYDLVYVDMNAAQPTQTSIVTNDVHLSITGLTNGHQYRFNVRGKSNGILGGWSPAVYAWFVVPTLPLIRLDTTGRAPIVSKDVYIPGTFQLVPGGGGATLTSTMQIKGRGNTTWVAPKKPYRIKLDTSVAPLGMTKSKNWVLLADYFDPTHLRNETTFEIGQQTGLAWTPHGRQVEVILNGSYQGVYELVENIRIDPTRVNIDALTPSDTSGDALTGGYLAELDNYPPDPGEYGWTTPLRMAQITLKDPSPYAPEQASYIRDYVASFEQDLYGPGFADPTTGYRAYLDVASMIDDYLVQELTRNQDAFLGSTYFFKPRLGVLHMGPLWDFDNSMGNTQGWDTGSATGWFVRRPGLTWIARLFEDPSFSAAVAARWDQLRPVFEQMPARILADGAVIAMAMTNDRAVWGTSNLPVSTPQQLADWLQARIDWIDANIHTTP
jgi:hypothetical protein